MENSTFKLNSTKLLLLKLFISVLTCEIQPRNFAELYKIIVAKASKTLEKPHSLNISIESSLKVLYFAHNFFFFWKHPQLFFIHSKNNFKEIYSISLEIFKVLPELEKVQEICLWAPKKKKKKKSSTGTGQDMVCRANILSHKILHYFYPRHSNLHYSKIYSIILLLKARSNFLVLKNRIPLSYNWPHSVIN